MASSTPAANEKKAGTSNGTAYISGGRLLDAPPLSARFNALVNHVYGMAGLYVTTLFSLDPYEAAADSRFNTTGTGAGPGPAPARPQTQGRTLGSNGNGNGGSRWFGWGSGGNGAGGRSGSSGRRFGTVDDVRGPECGSCQ